jgi:polar amino acid transport system substrate-binding protein
MKRIAILTLVLPLVLMGIVSCSKHELTISNVEDLKQAEHANIGAMTGTTGEALAMSNFPDATIKSFDDIMDAVAAIKSGQLDAIVTAFPTALQVTKKNPDLKLLEEPLELENTAIAFKKDNPELLAQVNAVIAEFKADGTLQDMQQRWLKADMSPYEEVDIALPASGEVLKVGVSATREPLTFVDKNGKVSGHDGELASRIGQKLNRPVEFFNMKFMALIPALESGKVDMILTGMTATEERKKHVSFSEPYFSNSQVILVRNNIASKPALKREITNLEVMKLADLHHKRIAVLTGSAGDIAAHQHFPQAEIHQMVASADAALAVKRNKVDAFVYDKSVLLNLADKNPDLQILSEPLTKLKIAVAVKKGNRQLLQDVNALIQQYQKDGKLQALRSKWIESQFKETPALPVFNKILSKEKLRVGTCAEIEPFSFRANGVITGLDIELARLFAEKLGRQLVIVDMSFESLIPALQSGKIDLALSNFNVTEARKKFIDFSQAYVENDITALVRRSASTTLGMIEQPALTSTTTSETFAQYQRIGVLLGSVHDNYAIAHYPDAAVMHYKTASDLVLAVKAGKVDAAIYDEEPIKEILMHNSDLMMLDKTLFTLPIGIGINQANADLRLRFNQFLVDIKKNGIYDDMLSRWILKGDRHMPDIKAAAKNGTLRAGVSDVGLPFVAVKDNQLVGFDVELLKRFAAREGKALELTNYEFGSLVAAVASGKADLIASAIYVTDERKKQIDFSDAYIEKGAKWLVLKSNTNQKPIINERSTAQSPTTLKLQSVNDLQDKRIGVLLGSVHDTYAMQHYPKATVLQYKSPSDILLAVKSGKVDAAIYTRETLMEILEADKALALLGNSLQSYPIAIGFNQHNDALRNQFNQFLASIKKDRTYDAMVQRWIKNNDTRMPVIPNIKVNGMLVAGNVSDKGLPFTAVQNGQLVGFDIELAQRFGANLGKEVKFIDMEFGSLIPAVAANKIDMIVSTLMMTDERKKKIDFSDPYYELGANAFALSTNIIAQPIKNDVSVQAAKADANLQHKADKKTPSFIARTKNSFYSNIIQEDRYLLILDGLKVTVIISIFASLFGTLLGCLICYMRMSSSALLNLPAKIFISIIRGTPVLVFLMLIFYVVFASVNINPVIVAIIAFGMNFAAYVSEIFRSGISGVDKGQIEAGIAMGFTKLNTFIYITLPQTIQRILPVYKGEFISLVKMTSIVGYIAVQDLTKASDIIRSRTFDAFFPLVMIAILYFLISWVLMQSLEYLERATDPKQRRKKRMKA